MSAAAPLYAIALWFVSTAAIVWLDSRPSTTFRTSFRAAGFVAIVALAAIVATRGDSSATGAYIAFTAAVLVWGWHEIGFLMGLVAGPRREPLPEGVTGWARFRLATATVIHHEIALAVTLVLIAALTWGQANQAALWAFGVLFALRLSAKLNLFLGVPNLSDEVFPAHLAYLKSYFGTRSMNPLFPLSLLLATLLAATAWAMGDAAPAGSGARAAGRLAASFAVLGLVEHLFLVLPLRDGKLWKWAIARKDAAALVGRQ